MAAGRKTGGRQIGTPNKATAARQAAEADAAALIPPELIDRLTPAEYLDVAWKALAKAGLVTQAISVAKEAAPYFNAKLAPKPERSGDDDVATLGGYAVTPDQAESMEAWTAESREELQDDERSGDPNPDPKPSS